MTTDPTRSVAKRHHVVPQFYLRGFADGEKLTTVRLPGDQRFTQVVRKAASETNFYALEGHEGGEDAFEKALASVEGETAGVFDSVVRGVWPLPSDDRTALAYFVALQAVRGPEQRRNMEHVLAQKARIEIGYTARRASKAGFIGTVELS